MFSDQFLQIATYLPTKNIYGFGENTHQSLRHDLNYRTWPLFARDMAPGDVILIIDNYIYFNIKIIKCFYFEITLFFEARSKSLWCSPFLHMP
jgi:hypothetical protein